MARYIARVAAWVFVAALWAAAWSIQTAPVAAAPPAAAPSPAAREAVRYWLDETWDSLPAARQQASRAWQQLPSDVRGEPSVQYAYGLVLLKQRRYDESLARLESLLQLEPRHLPARQLHAYLAVLTRQYPLAITQLELLGRDLADRRRQEAASEAAWEVEATELARFLGRGLGFLRGPAAGRAPAAQVDALQRQLLATLDDELEQLLLEALDEVIERYEQLSGRREGAQEQAEAEAERQREQVRADLDDEREFIRARREELADRRAAARESLDQRLEELSTAERPLADQLAAFDQQALYVRRELSLAYSHIRLLQGRLEETDDRLLRDRLRREIVHWQWVLSDYSRELGLLDRRAAGLQGQLQQLHRQASAARNEHAATVRSISDEFAQLERRERRIEGEQRRLERLQPRSQQLRALRSQIDAYATYEPLSTEAERQRLLEQIGPR